VESEQRDHELIPLAKGAREEGVSIRLLRAAVGKRDVETFQFGSPRIWIRREELRRWLDHNRTPARDDEGTKR
jgi:hypothetical protein